MQGTPESQTLPPSKALATSPPHPAQIPLQVSKQLQPHAQPSNTLSFQTPGSQLRPHFLPPRSCKGTNSYLPWLLGGAGPAGLSLFSFPFSFSTFRHFARRFWNHTCRERQLKSLRNGVETETRVS